MSLLSLLLQTATIQRPSIGRDAVSGVTQSFQTIAADVPCNYQEKIITVLDLYGQRNTSVKSTLYFAEDPNTEVNDRILVDKLNQCGVCETIYLLVKGEAEPVGHNVQWEVDVERIRQPQ